MCSSESVLLVRSAAMRAARVASSEPSVARRILAGKMLISLPPLIVLRSSPRRLCLPVHQMLDHLLDQEPVYLVYLDPTADVLDEAGPRPRPEATVGDLEIADVV